VISRACGIFLRKSLSKVAAQLAAALQLRMMRALRMVALFSWPKWGGIWYFDIPSPNTTVFSVLRPLSIALWGSLVPPYSLVVLLEAFEGT
jgi:hypothetical protein